ncbi:MAG TPA: autotransporter domain-containing protein [Alphaproteobacteria bacterium]|jgi:outer membrane lipase/esterase|nr:autotransporter domain-containing protein [Alphaproteobacteria bacterium]
MRFKALRQTAIALALATSCIGGTAAAQGQYSSIVIFGDSLSDPGNIPKFFGINQPPPPYYQNEFSNGPIYAKYLDGLFGIGTPLQDYAIGGAGTGSNNIVGLPGNPSIGLPNAGMDGQISYYLANNARPDPRSLFILWGGANDYFNILDNFKGGGPTGAALKAFALSPTGPVTTTIGGLVSDITRLAQIGVRNFVVPNVPNLGVTPSYLGNAREAGQATLITNLGNRQLASAMGALQQKLHVNITIVDIDAVFGGVLANPKQFGLSNVTKECIQNPTCVAQHGNYLFWDDVHPTGQVQAELSEVFLASLDGPTTVGAEIDLDKVVQQNLFDHISARTAALRLGASGLSVNNIGGVSAVIGGDGDHQLAGFITDSYGWGSRDTRSNVVSFDYNTNMISGGVDYRLNDWTAVGAMFGYSSTNDTLGSSLGSQSFDSYQFAIYATAYADGWYASVAGTYSYQDWGKIDRNVFIGNQVAQATSDGHVFGGKLEGGYVIQRGQWTFGPAVEVRAADYHIGGYTEHGTFGLNQEVDSQQDDSVVGQVGLQAALSTMIGDYAVTPQIRAGFDHEFHNTTRAIITRIASQASTFVTTDLAPEGSNYARLGAGVDVKLTNTFSALVDFDSTVGRDGGEDYSVLARLKGTF